MCIIVNVITNKESDNMTKLTYDVVHRLTTIGIRCLNNKGETVSTISLCYDLLNLWTKTESKVLKKECRKLIAELLELNE